MLRDLMCSVEGHKRTLFAQGTRCALQQQLSCESVPKRNPGAMHLPLNAWKSTISSTDRQRLMSKTQKIEV